MRRALLGLVAAFPAGALAQQVPAIQANTTATATATGSPVIVNGTGGGTPAKPPAGWPPAVQMLAPSAPLDTKEKKAVTMATAWRDRADSPVKDATGVLRWRYGSSQTRIVCAPVQLCDLELHPGEVIDNVRIGDEANWTLTKAISAGKDGVVSHIVLSPHDAGLSTSMLVYTTERTYSVKLVAVQHEYTPLTGFTYPQDHQDDDRAYANQVAALGARGKSPAPAGGSIDPSRIELLEIKGDRPSWRPQVAYTDGRKTYITFPKEIAYGDSPTLVGVNDDGGLFSSATQRRVIYRWINDRIIVDGVQDKLALVLGVGSGKQEVTINRKTP